MDRSKPVEVYRNLHKGCWSVRQRGHQIWHTDFICLKNVACRVSQKGRDRVLRERRKNVHAYIKGFPIDPVVVEDDERWIPITYNPYLYDSFVDNDQQSVLGADYAVMDIESETPVMVIPKEHNHD